MNDVCIVCKHSRFKHQQEGWGYCGEKGCRCGRFVSYAEVFGEDQKVDR